MKYALLLLLLFLPFVNAQDVEVGLYLLNLGKFDVSSGAFTADFYLSMRCERNCSDFEFVNGRASSVEKIIDSPKEKFYRVQAALVSPVDLRSFPFDVQRMEIALEDKRSDRSKVVFSPNLNESGIDPSVVFVGWDVLGWRAFERPHRYDAYDETFSQYVFAVDIARIGLNSFFKTFVPVLIIVLIVLFSFVMDPDKITNRLTVATSSLVGAIVFHISIANQIPPIGYLTIADKFMILTYFILLLSALLNIGLLELSERKKSDVVERVHRATEYTVFVLVPLLYAAFFFIVLP